MAESFYGDDSGAFEVALRNEGVPVGKSRIIDFVGPGFAASLDGSVGVVTAINPAVTLDAQSLKPTAATHVTFDRSVANPANAAALVSGTLFLTAVSLVAGEVITNITFVSGTQAMVTGTNQWFGLWSSARVCLALTDDDTSTAWNASTAKTLALTTPYTVPTTGVYYIGCMVAAGTAPSLQCLVYGNTTVANIAPILQGASNTGMTAVPSLASTATAITVNVNRPFAYTS